MNEGVRILLDRIASNPEDFDGLSMTADGLGERLYTSKWGGIFIRYWNVLEKEEQDLIQAKIKEANRQNFTSAVLRTIMTPEPQTDKEANLIYAATSASSMYKIAQGKSVTNVAPNGGVAP